MTGYLINILCINRLIRTIVFIVLLSFPVNSWSETLWLTIDDSIEIALKNNPQIEVANQQYRGSEGILTQARSRYLPHLGTGLSYGRVYAEVAQPVDEDNVGTGLLEVSQLIYDFGKTTGLIDASAYGRDATIENLKQIYHNVVFSVKSSFYSVLESKRLITVAEQAVSNYEQQLYRAQRYFQAGVRNKIDVTNAQVNLSRQKLALLRANSDLKVAKTRFEQVLGAKPNSGSYDVKVDEVQLASLSIQKPDMPESLDNLLVIAQKNRPGLKQFAYLIKAAESGIKQAKGDYWPTINATGDYHGNETDLSNLGDQWQVGVGLTWELFSGFETEGKVVEETAFLREVKSSLREFDLTVTQEVTNSYLRADENREGVEIADQTLVLAQENLDLAEGRYKSGIGDVLEFNDAQLLYTENQSDLVITYYNYLTALARIERAVGVIPELEGHDFTP